MNKGHIYIFYPSLSIVRFFLEYLILGNVRDRETVYRKAINMIDDWVVGDIEETLKDNIESFFCLEDKKKKKEFWSL